MSPVDKFMAYLQELEESYTRLSGLLNQKLNALNDYDIKTLDGIIKEEQAYVLIARGFETSLEAHRKKLGLQGETLAEVIEELPEECRDAFRVQHKRLSATLQTVKTLSEKCQMVAQDRLHILDSAIKNADAKSATYKKEGAAKPPSASFFTKTV